MAWEKRRLGKQLEGMKRTASIRSQYLGVEEVPVVSVWTVPTRRGLRHEVFKTEASTEEEERFLRCVLCKQCFGCVWWVSHRERRSGACGS